MLSKDSCSLQNTQILIFFFYYRKPEFSDQTEGGIEKEKKI
jgi:hypothetical protein